MGGLDITDKYISFVAIFTTAVLYYPLVICSSQCRPTVMETSSVEVGDNVSFQSWFSLDDGYSGQDLIWKRNRGDPIAVCLATTTQYDGVHTLNCSDIRISRYHLTIGNCNISCSLDLMIENAVLNDTGLYFLESASRCRLLMVDITVRETKPICTATYPKNYMYIRMTCIWVPQHNGERVWFSPEDQTWYQFENHTWRNELYQYVLLDDALCNEKSPDTCTVSQFSFDKRCHFLTRSHEVIFINNQTNESFKFYTSCKSSPKVWMYDKTSSPPLVNILGQSVTFDSETDKRSCGNDQIILIYGEDNYEEQILSGVTHLVLASNSHFDLGFSLQTSHDNEQCSNELFINISKTEISVQNTSCTGETCDNVFKNKSSATLHLILVISILTFLLIVMMCLYNHRRLIPTCRNIGIGQVMQQSGTDSGDEENTRNIDDHESIQMTSRSNVAIDGDEPLEQDSHENDHPSENISDFYLNYTMLPLDQCEAKVTHLNDQSNVCWSADRKSNDVNVEYSAKNEAVAGTTENVYSSVDDVRVPVGGISSAYNETSELCSTQSLSPCCESCDQTQLYETLPGSQYELVHGLKQSESTSYEDKHENNPECLYAIPHKLYEVANVCESSLTAINRDDIYITSSDSSQKRHPISTEESTDFHRDQNVERNYSEVSSKYDTLNLQEVEEDYDNLRRPGIEHFIGK